MEVQPDKFKRNQHSACDRTVFWAIESMRKRGSCLIQMPQNGGVYERGSPACIITRREGTTQ